MRTFFRIATVAVFFAGLPSPCFAEWEIALVTRERAKELGVQVRSTPAGPNHVRVELEFKVEGELQGFSRVDLRIGTRVTAPLREDRSKPGRATVSFSADRAQLDQITLWVMIPGTLGGTVYEVRVKDFVEVTKGR